MTDPATNHPDATTDADRQRAILFTAFEPSGDDHAATVIRELKRREPGLSIYAWGGPKMARAGAEIVAETGQDAVVGLPGVGKIMQHLRMNREISQWIREHPEITLHVPVDSPSANFPIAKAAKKHGRKVVHLVAPQLWAWRPGRIKKLRRCTDRVLCLLPFEETYFVERGVPATFIGHPLFDEAIDLESLSERAELLPQGSPRLALLPGSRPAELRRNFPVMLNAFRILRDRYPGLVGCVAATTDAVRSELYERARELGGWPEGLDVRVGETDLVIRWADLALVVSGTVSLQVARQATPMVLMYKVNKLFFRFVSTVIGFQARYFTLPNLIADQEVIPELIPYFKGPHRLVDAASRLLDSPERQEAQRIHQRMITGSFAGTMASHAAAQAILETAGYAESRAEPTSPSVSNV
ncbi:MAG: lipid-A-disaccharide synthase [Planctomycetota bacterium]